MWKKRYKKAQSACIEAFMCLWNLIVRFSYRWIWLELFGTIFLCGWIQRDTLDRCCLTSKCPMCNRPLIYFAYCWSRCFNRCVTFSSMTVCLILLEASWPAVLSVRCRDRASLIQRAFPACVWYFISCVLPTFKQCSFSTTVVKGLRSTRGLRPGNNFS